MSSDDRESFERRLDALIAAYRDRLAPREIAQSLVSTANGVVELTVPRPTWDAEQQLLLVPYREADALEQALEDLLTRRAICVPLDVAPPPMTDLTVRICAGQTCVDLRGRIVQSTPAGVVLQLDPAAVETQRELIALGATLRTRPEETPRLNRNAVRFPDAAASDDAPTAEETPPVPAAPEPSPPVGETPPSGEPEEPPQADAPTPVEPEPTPAPRRVDADLQRRLEHLGVVEKRMGLRDEFEVLGIHFTATADEVEEAWGELATLTDPSSYGDALDEPLAARLAAVRERVRAAYETLRTQPSRHRHRLEVANSFKIESALQMYEKKADSHKIRREIPDAVDAYRRIVELRPNDREARHQLEVLQSLLDR